MPKKKERSALKWDEIRNDPEKKNKIDGLFDFDKRNFLARGGELYYLHILQGLQNNKDKQEKLEYLLRELLLVQGKKMSEIASFIQKIWEENNSGYITQESNNILLNNDKILKIVYLEENIPVRIYCCLSGQ